MTDPWQKFWYKTSDGQIHDVVVEAAGQRPEH